MNYYLFIPFVIIIIFFLPIKMEARVSFNVLDFSGAFGVFFYKIKLTHQQFWIKGKKIITKKDNEIETKEMDFQSEEVIFLETFMSQIKDKTRLRELSVFYNIGVKDAFLSAMLAGLVNFAITIIFTNIKNKKPTATLSLNDTVSYNRELCQFAVKAILSISLFDVAYSLLSTIVISKKKHSKLDKEQKQTSVQPAKQPKQAKQATK